MGRPRSEYIDLVRDDMEDFKESNRLLYHQEEFSAKDIARALDRALDRFNTTAPNLGTFTFEKFPSDTVLIDLAIYYLLRRSLLKRGRNDVTYTESGNSINDQNFNQYRVLLGDIGKEAEANMMHLKKQINMSRGFGIISSPYKGL